MRNATRVFASIIGGIMGLAGLEHGIGELLQGNIAPAGSIFPSWPDSAFFSIMAGEPAMTIIPNLFITGLITCLISLIFVTWAIVFINRQNGGLVLILLSIVMLLVGGGIFPPILGIIVGTVATRINAPLTWWRTHLSTSTRNILGRLWPWFLGACVIVWLSLIPGLAILGYFFGMSDSGLVLILLVSAFGFLLLTIFTGFASDSLRQKFFNPPSMSLR